ncbi:hypothetical protein VNI00_011200 [Paramarasmius palmivorus]|uniref:Uncharacterized protein n=1 Tax=Paramarasmius palmivorus TaxID=297713 RepID=A0AAW0CFK9_9AGAR
MADGRFTEHVMTQEGGPDRDPANPPHPRPRVAPKPISKPKKMSARMKSRMTIVSDQESGLSDEDGANEDGANEDGAKSAPNNKESYATFLPSFQPVDPSCLFDDDGSNVNAISAKVVDNEAASPAPVDEPTPAPVDEPTPAPVDEPTPAPVDEPTPAPVDDSSRMLVDSFTDSYRNVDGEATLAPLPGDTEDCIVGIAMAIDIGINNSLQMSAGAPGSFSLPSIVAGAIGRIPSGDAGEWLRDAVTVLTTSESMVETEVWQHIIYELVNLESQYLFINNSRQRLHSSVSRPEIYKKWFKDARTAVVPEPFPPLEDFRAELWAWWREINPEWRERIGDHYMSRSGDGDWTMLRCPGQNGLLLLTVGLRWWYLKESIQGGSKEWNEFAEDVLWVLEKVSDWEKKYPQPPPPSQKPPPASCISEKQPSSTQPHAASKPRSSQRLQSFTQPKTASKPRSGRGTIRFGESISDSRPTKRIRQ